MQISSLDTLHLVRNVGDYTQALVTYESRRSTPLVDGSWKQNCK